MMKNILCYGDSNTWGNIAGSMNMEVRLAQRFEFDDRWPGILQKLLGNEFHIIEAALNGRTTCLDETSVIRPSRNGFATLPGILDMHYPLDLVIFMLGTNDLKIEFNSTAEQITQNMFKLIDCVKRSSFGQNYKAPQMMLIAPAPIFRVDNPAFDLFYNDASIAMSHELNKHYEQLAKKEQCMFLDAGLHVKISQRDGIHIEKDSQANLAKAIYEVLRRAPENILGLNFN